MDVNLAEAKAKLSVLVAKAEAGETVRILRRGKLVAQLVAPERTIKPINVDALDRLAATLPLESEESGAFLRGLRDDARY